MLRIRNGCKGSKNHVYAEYLKWCKERKLPTINRATFNRKLKDVFPHIKSVMTRIDNKPIKVWLNLKFKKHPEKHPKNVRASSSYYYSTIVRKNENKNNSNRREFKKLDAQHRVDAETGCSKDFAERNLEEWTEEEGE